MLILAYFIHFLIQKKNQVDLEQALSKTSLSRTKKKIWLISRQNINKYLRYLSTR